MQCESHYKLTRYALRFYVKIDEILAFLIPFDTSPITYDLGGVWPPKAFLPFF